MASNMEARTKQICVIEFRNWVKIAPVYIRRRLLNVYGDQTVYLSTAVRFSSGDSDVRGRPRSEPPCKAASSRTEEPLKQRDPSGLLEHGQTINSDRYVATLTKLKARIFSHAR
jgi:hypothetical protein